MKTLRDFANIHAHGITGPEIITSIEPADAADIDAANAETEAWYSVGIHPWHAAAATAETFDALRTIASQDNVVAIGECGFDKNRCDGLTDATEILVVQERVFREHVRLSEELGKPLIIHCVGRYGRLLELHAELAPKQLWVVHGFTGKPELARQLAAQGIGISLGPRTAKDKADAIAKVVPLELLFSESD